MAAKAMNKNMFITGKSSSIRHHTLSMLYCWVRKMLLLHQHNTSPGFLVTLFLKVVFCTKKITLDTTMRTVTDLLTSYFSHVMRKIETVTKVKESRNCLPTPNPERKQGHPFSLSVFKIHEPCLYSAVNIVVACLFTVSAPPD